MQTDIELNALGEQMRAWRRDIHQHPELGFHEHRTAGLVAKLLADWGIDVQTGIGGTGVVGTLRGTRGDGPSLGLRADMDALPMSEKGTPAHRSTHDNVFHGCGHDGHTSILLGVAKYLASHRDFRGTVRLIFQPAEETLRGGSAMIDDGLFERFHCDEIYALHNNNQLPAGKIGVRSGAILSACDLFRINIKGVGSHAAMPHKSIDPLIVGTTIVQSIQSIVSRNINPLDTTVVSVCKFLSGTAINVIPDTAVLEGTVRTLSVTAQETTLARLRAICEGAATMYGCEVSFEHLQTSPPTLNTPAETETVRRAAGRVLGVDNVIVDVAPLMASEDFAFMLQQRPGSYFFLGHDGLTCHHPEFDFDDDTAPAGAAVFIEIVRQRLG
ncbi:M20 aminoacylase family protein [Paraburkholderia sp.]|uniref:M20 aminoacylase family protein n=1 Tax=Paraburkholderia sp. TaxID=1926495 RepID=UPI0039E4CEE6